MHASERKQNTDGGLPSLHERQCSDFHAVEKDTDQVETAKVKTNAATGNQSAACAEVTMAIESGQIRSMSELHAFNAESAADPPDCWRELTVCSMSKPKMQTHPLKPWQESLLKKSQDPSDDREVIFMIDREGNAGKTHFTGAFEQECCKSHTAGADKRDDISLMLINHVVEDGQPNAPELSLEEEEIDEIEVVIKKETPEPLEEFTLSDSETDDMFKTAEPSN